jgi:hypothetical protein
MNSSTPEHAKFSSGLSVLGWTILFGTALFSVRFVYEQTILTWRDGWQMVGFSLAHTHPGFLVVGGLSAICAHVFLIVLLGFVIAARLRGRPLPRPSLVLVLTLGLVTGILYVPYTGWMTLMVKVWGPGQHGDSFLSFAAAEHHPHLARTLIDSGVPVDAPYDGHTALNAACVEKDAPIAKYLLSKGADLNRAPDCEWLDEVTGKKKRIEVPSTSVEVH